MQVGFIGVGKMGSRMILKLLFDKHEAIVWNRSKEPIAELELRIKNEELRKNLKVAQSIKDLIQQLDKPRVIWTMLPAGEATESVLQEVTKYVEPEDIVIDGGNAHFADTELRYQKLKTKNIRFLGIGVSGGILAVKNGYPLMVGGDKSAYEYVRPILETLSKPHGGYDYFGQGGAGHYIKMVHNGIEYGIMQSLGEGFGVLQKSQYNFDLLKIAKIYQKGTLVSGFMLDRTIDALSKDPSLSNIAGVIGKASGETVWTIEEAKKHHVPVPIIEGSLEFRNKSETDPEVQHSFAAKMVAAQRREFGGHEIKKK